MDPDRLTAALADRLSAIVPAGFHVTAADGMLRYSADAERGIGTSGTHVRNNFGLHGESAEENITGAGVQALDDLQDYISEATGEPWPGTTSQPSPRGRIRDSRLELWYGSGDDTLLSCAPIHLTEPG